MFAIFDAIIGFFEAVFALIEFVINFIGDLIYIIMLTGEFLLKIPEYFAWLPGTLLSLVVTAFGIVVIYKVLGREG